MLTEQQARDIFSAAVPDAPIQAQVLYRDVYLFRVIFPSPEEAEFDPFFSVDVETGEVRDFNVMLDGDLTEITAAFLSAEQQKGG